MLYKRDAERDTSSVQIQKVLVKSDTGIVQAQGEFSLWTRSEIYEFPGSHNRYILSYKVSCTEETTENTVPCWLCNTPLRMAFGHVASRNHPKVWDFSINLNIKLLFPTCLQKSYRELWTQYSLVPANNTQETFYMPRRALESYSVQYRFLTSVTQRVGRGSPNGQRVIARGTPGYSKNPHISNSTSNMAPPARASFIVLFSGIIATKKKWIYVQQLWNSSTFFAVMFLIKGA